MKNRNPILAFILSFVFSGLGQLYNGEIKKAVLFFILIFPLYLILGLIGLLSTFIGFVITISVLLFYKVAIGIEAYRTAKRLNPYEVKPINKTWKYIVFILMGFCYNGLGVLGTRAIVGYEAFEIPTPSMEPTIDFGDRIMATRINKEEIQLGDIITFEREDGQKYLSRVVGLPNQEIEIIDDVAIINGNSEEWTKSKISSDKGFEYQEYACKASNGQEYTTKRMTKYRGKEVSPSEYSNMAVQTIPSNEVYVMGDNRNNTMDSRMYGTIQFDNIDKKVNYIWWSNKKNKIGKKLN